MDYSMEEDYQEKSTFGFKAIIIFLGLLLLGSLGYTYKIIKDSNEIERVLISEKDAVLKDLAIAKDSLDFALASKSVLSKELLIERDKVQQLIKDFGKSGVDLVQASKYKTEALDLKNKVNNLMVEVQQLKKLNSELTVERDNAMGILVSARKSYEKLKDKNSALTDAVELGSKLAIVDFKAGAYSQKSSGKQSETDKASRADIIKVSFNIAENKIAKAGDKTYYVQITDAANKVLGEMKTENFGEKAVTYSFSTTVKYENKTMQVAKDLKVADLDGGAYNVSIYDRGQLISKSILNLR
jgi:hypothetical protein